MKKPMSSLSTADFMRCLGALGGSQRELACLLHCHYSTVSRYVNGAQIPVSVANKLEDLIKSRLALIQELRTEIVAASLDHAAGKLLEHTNVQRQGGQARHATEGRLMRRQGTPDTSLYPLYRMTRERFNTYVHALVTWRNYLLELCHHEGDPARLRDYKLELADLKNLAALAPRQAPYEVCIQRSEAGTVSRALTHVYKTRRDSHPKIAREARALYEHWRTHRGSGYPPNRESKP